MGKHLKSKTRGSWDCSRRICG